MTPPEQIARTLVLPYLNHAVRMYESSYASREDIDAATVRDEPAVRFAQTGDARSGLRRRGPRDRAAMAGSTHAT